MADTRVLIAETRADLSCTNCGTTQTHRIRLYYNDTADKLEVDRECVCAVDATGVGYEETYEAAMESK